MRNQISIKLPSLVIKEIDEIAAKCNMTRGNTLEVLSVLEILKNPLIEMDDNRLNSVIDTLVVKGESNIKKEFREHSKKIPFKAKKVIIDFWIRMNLLENIRYSCHKQANLYLKGNLEEFLFYYATVDVRKVDIEVYIKSINLKVQVKGPEDKPSNEYVYIGKRRYFNRRDQESKIFQKLCEKLKVENCDAIKIHYTKLYELLNLLVELNTEKRNEKVIIV